MIFTLNCCR